ncbi:hypothetical protein [Caballeronia telluris]|uniref:Lipoprotein n=1 Tax=Caballeronia telluris TaxID=326475 RepID=A0A158G8F8_9BURK|nr:hypothetical protein [Caballeronia telluris]SAL28438.1 hypothetical protein AWB66_01670 [Caballeronia telluris]
MSAKTLACTAALVWLAACSGGSPPFVQNPSVTQLDRMEKANQSARQTGERAPLRSMAAERIDCTSRADAVCERLFGLRANACAQLTNTGDAPKDAAARQCAVSDYEQAIRLLPDPPMDTDRTALLAGLADALKSMRPFASPANAAALQSHFDDTLGKLQAQPDGQPYAAYFRADADATRAMNGLVAPAQVCPTLTGARNRLATTRNASAELSARIERLSKSIDTFSAAKGCT